MGSLHSVALCRLPIPGATQIIVRATISSTNVPNVQTHVTGAPASCKRIIHNNASRLCHNVLTDSRISFSCAAAMIRLCAQAATPAMWRAHRGNAWAVCTASNAKMGTTGTRYRKPVDGWSQEYD